MDLDVVNDEFDIDSAVTNACRNGNLQQVQKIVVKFGLSFCKVWLEGYNLLTVSLEYHNTDVAKFLILSNCRVKSKCCTETQSPLYIAVENGFAEIVEMLLNKENTFEIIELNEMFLLAVESGHDEIVELLLKNRVDIDAKNYKGESALHLAVIKETETTIKLVLERNANCNVKDSEGYTPLDRASENNKVDIVKLLITHANSTTLNGAFYIAVKKGLIKIVRVFLEYKADINLNNMNGLTSLYVAIENRNVDIVKLLLENGAEINSTDKNGESPLYMAIRKDFKEIAELLLQSNADYNLKRADGGTPLHAASESQNADIVELLLEYKADVNCVNEDGRTPLHDATISSNVNAAKVLLEYGADPNAKCLKGMTPLHYAATADDNILKLILECNVDVNSVCNEGETPLFAAFHSDNFNKINILLDYNADINIMNKCGHTAVDSIHDLRFSYLVPYNSRETFSKHIYKREIAGLYIHDKIFKYLNEIGLDVHDPLWRNFDKNILKLLDFMSDCEEEINRIKCKVLIKGMASLHDILTNNLNQLARYFCNKDVVKIMDNINYEHEFPIYARMLCIQFKNVKDRKVLLEQFDLCKSIFPIFHPDCIDIITSYISNHDFKNLIKACQAM